MTIEELEHYKNLHEKMITAKEELKLALLLKDDINNSKQIRDNGFIELNTMNNRMSVKEQTKAGLIIDYVVKLCKESVETCTKDFEAL